MRNSVNKDPLEHIKDFIRKNEVLASLLQGVLEDSTVKRIPFNKSDNYKAAAIGCRNQAASPLIISIDILR